MAALKHVRKLLVSKSGLNPRVNRDTLSASSFPCEFPSIAQCQKLSKVEAMLSPLPSFRRMPDEKLSRRQLLLEADELFGVHSCGLPTIEKAFDQTLVAFELDADKLIDLTQ